VKRRIQNAAFKLCYEIDNFQFDWFGKPKPSAARQGVNHCSINIQGFVPGKQNVILAELDVDRVILGSYPSWETVALCKPLGTLVGKRCVNMPAQYEVFDLHCWLWGGGADPFAFQPGASIPRRS